MTTLFDEGKSCFWNERNILDRMCWHYKQWDSLINQLNLKHKAWYVLQKKPEHLRCDGEHIGSDVLTLPKMGWPLLARKSHSLWRSTGPSNHFWKIWIAYFWILHFLFCKLPTICLENLVRPSLIVLSSDCYLDFFCFSHWNQRNMIFTSEEIFSPNLANCSLRLVWSIWFTAA